MKTSGASLIDTRNADSLTTSQRLLEEVVFGCRGCGFAGFDFRPRTGCCLPEHRILLLSAPTELRYSAPCSPTSAAVTADQWTRHRHGVLTVKTTRIGQGDFPLPGHPPRSRRIRLNDAAPSTSGRYCLRLSTKFRRLHRDRLMFRFILSGGSRSGCSRTDCAHFDDCFISMASCYSGSRNSAWPLRHARSAARERR